MKRPYLHIAIFGVVTFGCGFLGNAINQLYHPQNPMESLGVLIWLVSPLAANLLLRSIGGEGWKDFGIGLNIKKGWKWYLAALLAIPLISLVVTGLGFVSGATSFANVTNKGIQTFFLLVGSAFIGSMVKNIFEEFAWRGYLTPRLEAIKPDSIINPLITGLIWAGWHIPYYLFFLDPASLKEQTVLNVPALIGMSFLILPVQALAYGELRLISKSVWPVWLMHTIANAISFALITGGMIQLFGGWQGILFTPGTEGIFYTLLLGLFGWFLRRRRIGSKKEKAF